MLTKLKPCNNNSGRKCSTVIANTKNNVPTPVKISVIVLIWFADFLINIQAQTNKHTAKTKISKILLPTISPKPKLPVL